MEKELEYGLDYLNAIHDIKIPTFDYIQKLVKRVEKLERKVERLENDKNIF